MTNPVHILVVDDDQGLRNLLQRYLGEQGFRVDSVADGRAMHTWLAHHKTDAIILDIMLPGEDGLSLARALRAQGDTPILMLSARGDEVDRIVGLEVGADDYLSKPFNPRELLARLRAIMRRRSIATTPHPQRLFSFGPFTLDLDQRRLQREGINLSLTGAEYGLLELLVQHPNQTMSRDLLLEQLQTHEGHERDPFDRSIDVRVTRLRRKIEENPSQPIYITTVRGIGYRFVPDGGA